MNIPQPALPRWNDATEARSRRIAQLGHQLSTAGAVLEGVVIIGAVGGVISGLVAASQSGVDSATGETIHPYVMLGVAITIGSVLTGVLYWALMRALRLFGDYAAFRVTSPGGLVRDTGSYPAPEANAESVYLPSPVQPVRPSKGAFEFLRGEYPQCFDAVWSEAIQVQPWPKYPSVALRAACSAVESGTDATCAVRDTWSRSTTR